VIWWIVAGVVGVVLLASIAFAFRNRYARVFADRHLLEFCEKLDDIRQAACAHVESLGDERDPVDAEAILADPRNAQTDGGMRLSYTVLRIDSRPGMLGHHLSMSHEDKLPAESFARFFAGLALVRFGLAPDEVAVQRSSNLVMHIMWEIAKDRNAEFASAREEPPASEDLPDLRERARDVGQALRLGARPETPAVPVTG